MTAWDDSFLVAFGRRGGNPGKSARGAGLIHRLSLSADSAPIGGALARLLLSSLDASVPFSSFFFFSPSGCRALSSACFDGRATALSTRAFHCLCVFYGRVKLCSILRARRVRWVGRAGGAEAQSQGRKEGTNIYIHTYIHTYILPYNTLSSVEPLAQSRAYGLGSLAAASAAQLELGSNSVANTHR